MLVFSSGVFSSEGSVKGLQRPDEVRGAKVTFQPHAVTILCKVAEERDDTAFKL